LGTIGDKYKEVGRLAWLSSFHVDFEFVKTDLITKFLIILFEQVIGIDKFSSIIRSFKQLNFEVNLASIDYLKDFPKVKAGEGFQAEDSNKDLT
jgi:hypothetical protein